jgi:hypothetical protein
MKLKAFIAALHAALFAILVAVSPAGSGSMMLLGVGKPAGGAPAAATLVTGSASTYLNGYAGSRSFANMNGGVSYPAGSVVVVFAVGSDGAAFTSPQMGAVNLNVLASATDATNVVASSQVFYASLPAGATDTFTFSNQGCCNKFGVYAVYFTGVNVATLTGAYQSNVAGKGDPQSADIPASLTIPTGGFGVIVQGTQNITSPYTITYQTTTPSFLVGATDEITGTTCASPGGVGCKVTTGQFQMTSQHSTTAGAGWVGMYTGGAFTDATMAIVIGP